ncbi:unnamed protein product, partial [Laminaria digitata]
PAGDRAVDLTDLAFGEVPLGASKSLAVGVANTGTARLLLCLDGATLADCTDLSRIQPDTAPFRAQFDNPEEDGSWAVGSNDEREFIVTFTPTDEAPVQASLILVHNAQSKTTTIN